MIGRFHAEEHRLVSFCAERVYNPLNSHPAEKMSVAAAKCEETQAADLCGAHLTSVFLSGAIVTTVYIR
jgi:hypothetical protein